MCGVIGYFSEKQVPEHVDTICRIFDESKIRGLHAFGATVRSDSGLRTFKGHEISSVKSFLKTTGGFSMMIGHNRYSTSGDWHDQANNQPIHLPGISMVFNGVISQASKEEYSKQYGKKYQTQNDGEIFARKVLDGEDWAKFVSEGRFSFAGMFIREGKAYAIRNKNRPLWLAKKDGAVFLASTRGIFARVANFAGNFADLRELPPGLPLELNAGLL